METRMNFRSKVFVSACGLAALVGLATIGGLRLAYAQPPSQPAAAGEQGAQNSPGPVATIGAKLGAALGAAVGELRRTLPVSRPPHLRPRKGRIADRPPGDRCLAKWAGYIRRLISRASGMG